MNHENNYQLRTLSPIRTRYDQIGALARKISVAINKITCYYDFTVKQRLEQGDKIMNAQKAFESGLAPFCQLPQFVYNHDRIYGEKLERGMMLYHRQDGRLGVAY